MSPQTVADYADLKLAIRERRRELGLTVAQLAALAGLPPHVVQSIETGHRCLGPANYRPILSALGLQLTVKAA